MFRSGRNPRIETTDKPIDAASRECSARAARARALGRCARGRGAEARRGAAEPATPASRAARRALARARHLARATRAPFTSIDAYLFELARVALGVAQVRFPRRALRGSERSRPPRRRGRRARRSRPWGARARRMLCQGRQPGGRAARSRVEQPLSRPRAPHAHRDAARAHLRPPELQKAPRRVAGRRPAQLRSVVRRLADPGASVA
jgi:hypothetical protein